VNVFGATLGGPIIRNKLFFFFSDETTPAIRGEPAAAGLGLSGFTALPPADLGRGLLGNRTLILTRDGNPRLTQDDAFTFQVFPDRPRQGPRCVVRYIPAGRIHPIAARC
jgi:hypothetical protein